MARIRIGLTISGAVSVGAFEGGALAALITAVQAAQRPGDRLGLMIGDSWRLEDFRQTTPASLSIGDRLAFAGLLRRAGLVLFRDTWAKWKGKAIPR